MNYGWLEPTTSLREYQRVVRHEFGHALGMIHEHQNPAAAGQIPWDKPKVYAYYAQQGWIEDDVDYNIFDVYDEDTTNFTEFDPTSIMQYAIPDSLTIGSYSVGWNTALSELDRRSWPSSTRRTRRASSSSTVGGERHAGRPGRRRRGRHATTSTRRTRRDAHHHDRGRRPTSCSPSTGPTTRAPC